MTKMATTPIYSKSLKIFFSSNKRRLIVNLCVQHRGLNFYNVYIKYAPGLTVTLRQGQIWAPMHLNVESCCLVIQYDNLQQMIKLTEYLCLWKIFDQGCCLSMPRGHIHACGPYFHLPLQNHMGNQSQF